MTQDGDRPRSRPLEGSVLGRYRLVRWLGEGGMGAVYEAIHLDLGKRAAIKTLHERFAAAPDARQRFLREGRAAAQIRHSNVADVYDVGFDGGYPYLVMELLEGEDLSRLLARSGPLPVRQCADLIVPVVAAVAAAHDLGIVHRDLKPENIFLSMERTGLSPKVLDFGISKLTDTEASSALTGTGALLGTPHYMSPEQARGDQQIDTRSDQYSLGVILYQCVTGRRPLQGVPLYALIQKTVHGDFPPPRQVHPALPGALEALILQAMARQPERRFPSTRALGQALAVFASDAVRTAYAAELGGVPPAAVAATPPEVPVAELSTTLGESAHVRAVAVTKPPLPRRLGLASVLLLAAGFVVWRWAPRSTPEQTAAALAPTTEMAQPPAAVAAAPRPESPAASPNAVAALQARGEHELAQGQLARAVDTFRKVYALGLDPLSLSRAAHAATELWRSTRRPAECQQARELWLAHLAVVADADARAASKAALLELGACGEPAESARVARPPSRPASSTPPSRLGAAPPSAPSAPSATETSPAAAPAQLLPSDDPGDGFLDVSPR